MENKSVISVEVYQCPGESGDGVDTVKQSTESHSGFLEKLEHINIYPFKDVEVGDEPITSDSILVDNSIKNDEKTNTNSEIEYIKIFIQRDYSVNKFIRFHNTFPKALEGKIEKQTFETTINQLNNFFEEPESFSCYTCTEGCLACLTAHLIYIFKPTPYEKCLKKVSKFVADENVRQYEPKGLKLVDPSLRGLRVLEISSLQATSNV